MRRADDNGQRIHAIGFRPESEVLTMHPTTFRNRKAFQIENDLIRVTVTEESGHIAEILNKACQISRKFLLPYSFGRFFQAEGRGVVVRIERRSSLPPYPRLITQRCLDGGRSPGVRCQACG